MIKNFLHRPILEDILTAFDFQTDVDIKFEDGSSASFKDAFAQREAEFYVVYTEHCGYHPFYCGSVVSISGLKELRLK